MRHGDVLVLLESDELRAALVQAQPWLGRTAHYLQKTARAAMMQADATLRTAQAE